MKLWFIKIITTMEGTVNQGRDRDYELRKAISEGDNEAVAVARGETPITSRARVCQEKLAFVKLSVVFTRGTPSPLGIRDTD